MPGQTNSYNELVFVQTPSSSSLQPYLQQPAITPRQIENGEWNNVGHLWPRSISYQMETNSVEAYVQSDLKVGMKYNYAFNFELSARTANGKGVAIPDGWYQLQVAVIKMSGAGIKDRRIINPYDRYVTSTSMFMKVSGGSFARRLSLRFSDYTQTSLKHHLFVELIPLREECEHEGSKVPCIGLNARGEPDATKSILEPRPGYKTYLVEMPFVPIERAGGRVRDADDLTDEEQAFLGGSLAKYIARAQLHRNKKDLQARKDDTPADHARKNLLDLVSLGNKEFDPVRPLIQKLLDTKTIGTLKITPDLKPIFAILCAQLVAHQAEFQERHANMPFRQMRQQVVDNSILRCAAQPEEYMRLNRVVHVGRPLAGQIDRIAQKSLNYSIMSNYMSGRSQSVDSSSTITVKPPGIIVKFVEQIGLGFGHSVSFSSGRSQSETGIASMSTSLDFNYVIFNIPVMGYQQCLEVRALPAPNIYYYDRRPGANTGVYICAEKEDKQIEIPEVYAHAFERCRDTSMMECDTLTQSVNVSLRGERDLSAFFYAIRGGVTPDHNNRVMPFGNLENAEKYFANTPQMDDMEVVTPAEFPSEKVPSFLKLISGQHREF